MAEEWRKVFGHYPKGPRLFFKISAGFLPKCPEKIKKRLEKCLKSGSYSGPEWSAYSNLHEKTIDKTGLILYNSYMTTRGLNGMPHYVYTMLLLCLTLVGCAGGPAFSVQTFMNNQVYTRDCIGPNAKYRPGDDECIYRNEPVPQPFSVQRVEKPDPNDIQWRIYCRRESSKSDPNCRGVN